MATERRDDTQEKALKIYNGLTSSGKFIDLINEVEFQLRTAIVNNTIVGWRCEEYINGPGGLTHEVIKIGFLKGYNAQQQTIDVEFSSEIEGTSCGQYGIGEHALGYEPKDFRDLRWRVVQQVDL